MSRKTRWISTLLGAGLVMIFVACGTDLAASGESDSPTAPATSVPGTPSPAQVVNDEPVGDRDDATVEAHVEEVHDEPDDEAHLESETEADDHAHSMGMVDPDAPLIHVIGNEFGYSPASFIVEAGHAFTVMLHNEGALEHDITIDGFEELGGIHLIAGEDGMNTFMLDEPGEYTYYCTVPGHREAGMTGTLVVTGDDHDEEAVEDQAEDGDEHADEPA